MTISFPDLSNNNGALTLQSGTVAAFSKTTEGNYFADGTYSHYINEAHRVGAVFAGYHFLRPGNIASQVSYVRSHDLGYPQMLDIEPAYNTCPSYADSLNFTKQYRAAGGVLNDWYLPHWVWQGQWGSPDLSEARSLGVVLHSSAYTAYSDTGPGWAAYGGITPTFWQYTDALSYAGRSVDFNAFKGTVAQLSAIMGAKSPSGPVVPPVKPVPAPVSNTTRQYRASHNTFTPLNVDKSWGMHTTQALQFVLGIAADGVFGPVTTRTFQGLLNVKQDGAFGHVSVTALQARVGAKQDGILGSETVGALQSSLNRGSLY